MGRASKDELSQNRSFTAAKSIKKGIMKHFFRRKHTTPANQQQVEQDLQNLDRAIQRDSQNSILHLQKSVALIKLGRFPEATQSVQTALRFDPQSLSTFTGKEKNPTNTQAFQTALDECDLNLRLPYMPILSTMDVRVISSRPDPQGAAERALHALTVAFSYQPLSLEIYSRRGEIMVKLLHEFEQALQAYDLAFALDAKNAQVNRDRAAVLYLLGRHQDALHQIESALRLHPDDPEALHTKGSTLYELAQYQQALECFDQAIRLEPSYFLPYLGKAFVLTAQNEPKQALADLDTALDLAPDFPVAYLMRGNLLLLLRRPREAVQAYDRALNLGLHESAAEDCMLKKCAALAVAGDIPQALVDLERVGVRFPRNMSVLLTKGMLLQEMDQFQSALATFNEAINLQPDFADAYTRKGILLATYEQPREAVLTLAMALKLEPGNLDALIAISTILNHLEQPRDALKFAETACEVSPEHADAHRQKGIALEGLQRYSEALQAYTRALMCNPQDANLYHDRGVLLDKMGRPEEALQSLDQALALNPQLLFSYHSKAIILHSLKRYREALEACETALQLDPTFQQAQMRKARILSEMSHKGQGEGPARLKPLPGEKSRGIPDGQEQAYITTEDTATPEQAQIAWEQFVTDQVLPAFHDIKAIFERHDGTTADVQQSRAGERWVRLTWMVAPSPSMLASLPPSARPASPPPPRTVLIFTIKGDVPLAMTTAWCETRIPTQSGDLADRSHVFLERLGDYRRKEVTKDTIQEKFLENYQRHILGSSR
jgi:tetratricopeptide (TPR) repeat protein